MVVLVAWIVAVVVALLVLGIVGYGLRGQLTRLNRAIDQVRVEVLPRMQRLQADLPAAGASGGRHSYEHKKSDAE